MSERRSPTLRRRRLSTELKKLREAKGLTASAVEKHFGWSPSKVSRMERNDWTLPNLRDVRDLLDLYEVADDERREELLGWARDGRQKGWWDVYKGLSPVYSNYISLEAEAKSIRTFQTSVVPGLLQTPAYARASLMPSGLQADEIEKRVEIRINRQQLLYGEDSLELVVVLDESVLRRMIGGPEVMEEQFGHLERMAHLPNVTMYVVPFGAATNLSTHTSFAILEFPHLDDRNAVYLETLVGDLFVEDPEGVRAYDGAFRDAIGAALDPQKSLDMSNKLV